MTLFYVEFVSPEEKVKANNNHVRCIKDITNFLKVLCIKKIFEDDPVAEFFCNVREHRVCVVLGGREMFLTRSRNG